MSASSDYADRIQRAIDYIEANLTHQVSLQDAARQACWSAFHFMRTFGAVVGSTFRQYVRDRRMEIAAYRLAFSDARVLEVAQSVGYDTQEAFTRAFKRIYGLSPGRYRTAAAYTIRTPPARVVLHPDDGDRRDRMEPKIEQISDKVIAGVELRTKNDGSNTQEVPEFWQRYLQERTADKIPGKIEPEIEYGLCTNMDFDTGEFSYVIGYEVAPQSTAPTEPFGAFPVPHGTYAVFTARGSTVDTGFVDAIQDTWRFIYGTWFVDNPTWERADGPDFERYDRRRMTATANECDICIPVRAR